jgi:hypothetical protein
MSWSLFKINILRKTNPISNPSININEVATIWAEEYDACIKRGIDFINLESIQAGNIEIMKIFFRLALLKGLATPPGVPFSLVNEFGNGVKAYWAGAQMRPFPIPLIPAPGSIQNIAVNSNIVINPGTWPIYPPLKPARKQIIMIDMFILAAIVHLFSVGGIIQTISLYPSAPTPIPAPGIISWTGYLIPPSIPIPNINFPSSDGSEPPIIRMPDGTDGSPIPLINEPIDNGLGNQPDGLGNQSDGLGNQSDGLGNPSDGLGNQSNTTNSGKTLDDTSLDNIINTSLPADVDDAVKVDEIIKDFKEQLVMGGTKCD